jgi:glycosyltransferase involved in cell wall biosynthesis
VNSILSQTYRDLEVLIMDDCSPDNTPEIAASFSDPRVRYVRNEHNLGHLQNYNKGIELSRGRYVWLISADDRLRRLYLLERYLRVMEENPNVGYACCPSIKLENGLETRVENCAAKRDTIFDGKKFLLKLLKGNCIAAASGMVRRSCYEKCGTFPLDLPYAGDWFLWCLFALHHDVAYFAEPMVNYRSHEVSMTNYLMKYRAAVTFKEGFVVLWRIRSQAQQVGDAEIVKWCGFRLARLYGNHLVGGKYESWTYRMTEEEFEASLSKEALGRAEENWIRARVWIAAGDCSLKLRKLRDAGEYYRRALQFDRWMMSLHARRFLLHTGDLGVGLTYKLLEVGRAAFRGRVFGNR